MSRRSGGSFGGMQSERVGDCFCACGKSAVGRKTIVGKDGVIRTLSLFFTSKSIYWHIMEDGKKCKRTFKRPEGWHDERGEQ